MNDRAAIAPIHRIADGRSRADQDLVAVEAPLAIELLHASSQGAQRVGILMRTPGDDTDLVLGLLYTEGFIASRSDVIDLKAVPSADGDGRASDLMRVTLAPHVSVPEIEERPLTPTSACGLCGRLAMRQMDEGAVAASADDSWVDAAVVVSIPATLRASQAVFAETGGLHAAGFFDPAGRLLCAREDVGRHNAVDKLVGAWLETARLPARGLILGVSGRVAFEIVQKAVAAGVSMIVAVGAPSSLAVEAARATRLTLVGFARDGRFNVYAGHDRIVNAGGVLIPVSTL